MNTLKAEKRTLAVKAKKLRERAMLPVTYSAKR